MVVTILLCGCGGTTGSDPKAKLITCHTAYRSSPGREIEREDSLIFSSADEQQKLSYENLVFLAQYSSGEIDQERALRLWVTEPGKSDPITVHLYQLSPDSGPQNQFVGGHGFTGLNYISHPVTEAELQFWCEVD